MDTDGRFEYIGLEAIWMMERIDSIERIAKNQLNKNKGELEKIIENIKKLEKIKRKCSNSMESGQSLCSRHCVSFHFQLPEHLSNNVALLEHFRILIDDLKHRASGAREIAGELASGGEQKSKERRRWGEWMRQVFGVELCADKVRVVCKLLISLSVFYQHVPFISNISILTAGLVTPSPPL